MKDFNPVWSYNDRGFYSMAFVGYIFLYMLILRVMSVPTPNVQFFVKDMKLLEESENIEEEDDRSIS